MVPYISEMIQMTDEERYLLGTLQTKAKSIASHFSDAMQDRLSKLPGNSSIKKPDSLYQKLFLHLFTDSGFEGSQDEETISMQTLLAGMDVIIHFGHAVAEYSTRPTRASGAFDKALARMMLEQQDKVSPQASYLYDMMLLD